MGLIRPWEPYVYHEPTRVMRVCYALRRCWKYGFLRNFHSLDFARNVFNCVGISRVYWGKDPSDWTTSLAVLAFSLEEQARLIEKFSYHVDKDADVEHIRICLEMIKRLSDSDEHGAFHYAGLRFPDERGAEWASFVSELEAEYLDTFMRHFKHFQSWWN